MCTVLPRVPAGVDRAEGGEALRIRSLHAAQEALVLGALLADTGVDAGCVAVPDLDSCAFDRLAARGVHDRQPKRERDTGLPLRDVAPHGGVVDVIGAFGLLGRENARHQACLDGSGTGSRLVRVSQAREPRGADDESSQRGQGGATRHSPLIHSTRVATARESGLRGESLHPGNGLDDAADHERDAVAIVVGCLSELDALAQVDRMAVVETRTQRLADIELTFAQGAARPLPSTRRC